MRMFAKLFAAAALAVCFAGVASAQGQGRGGQGGQPGGGRGMAGGMFGGGGVYGFLATNKALQEELKITPEQIKKFEDVAKTMAEKRREAMSGGFSPDMSDEDRKAMQDKMAKLATDTKKAYEEVLTKDQAKRVTQIGYQYMKVRAFSDKDVQTGLKMGDDQKDKIKTIMDSYQKDSRELMGAGGRGGQGGGAGGGRGGAMNEETRKKLDALSKEAEEKIVATLSDDQKKTWKEMIGEKFDVSKLTMQAPRNRDN